MLNYDQNGGRHRICVQKYIGHQRTLLNSKVEYRTSSGAQANAKGMGTASSSSMKTVNSDGSISTPDSESEDDEGEDVRDPWDDMTIELSPASNAIAVRWLRTARASLQRAKGNDDGGKGGMAARLRAKDRNKSGKKSKTRRK